MPSHLSSPWNNAVAFLAMYFGTTQLSSGSCFFWVDGEKTFLISNWHNFAGRNHLNGEPISPTNGIPDRITFMAYKQTSEPDADGFYELLYVPVEVRLCNKDLSEPRWLEHPTFGQKVDIAAIDVTASVQGLQITPANIQECDAILDPSVSQEIFVVGFPFGQIVNAPAPIWKRGTIALDPSFDPDSLPKMLVDTATREGMSGSLVLARHTVVGRSYPKKGGIESAPVIYAKIDLVVGVYSGRHYADLEKAQLGIVWKRGAIEQTVAGGTFASV